MKKFLFKTVNLISARVAYFIIGIICGIAILVSAYSVYAAIATVSPGDRLTSNKMNQIINELNSITDYKNRTWHDVKSSRSPEQNYKNNRDYPIEVAVSAQREPANLVNGCIVLIYVDGKLIIHNANNNLNFSKTCIGIVTIPPGSTYKVKITGSFQPSARINQWHELY